MAFPRPWYRSPARLDIVSEASTVARRGSAPVPEPSILASQVSASGALYWVAFFAAEAGACLAADQMGNHAALLYGEEQLWLRL